jgi:AhpD family alkylhydroperoxidase
VGTSKLSLRALAAGARTLWPDRRVLPRKLREAIVLRVSAVNECPVCSSVHERLAARFGFDPEQVREIQSGAAESVDARADIALRYAENRTLGRDDVRVTGLFEGAFTAEERREIDWVVDRFTFNNAFNNTWEAVLPGATRRRERFRR